jgi:molybdopterin molybdotransferase
MGLRESMDENRRAERRRRLRDAAVLMPGHAAFRHSVEEHLDALAPLLAPLRQRGSQTVTLEQALDRVVDRDVVSPVPIPLFRNSQMDGYAVRAADVAAAPVTLPVVIEIAAGPIDPDTLAPGTAARIMTGAPMPPGADAVVPVEQTRPGLESERDSNRDSNRDSIRSYVEILSPTSAGRYVREPGSDLPAGSVLVSAGRRLGPRQLAALAAAGLDRVTVRTPVRVAVISTGSELIAPGAAPALGELFDSNSIALTAAARAAGAAIVHHARVRDDHAQFTAELDAAVDAGAELIVTSGGISMGEHEVVRETLEPLGVLVGTVSMQPGGPQGYGRYRGVPVLCFPGNPVSSQLSFELFAAPPLRDGAGRPSARRTRERAAVGFELFDAVRRQFQRGRLTSDGRVEPVGGPGSHLVVALASAELLIVVAEGSRGIRENDEVDVVWLS